MWLFILLFILILIIFLVQGGDDDLEEIRNILIHKNNGSINFQFGENDWRNLTLCLDPSTADDFCFLFKPDYESTVNFVKSIIPPQFWKIVTIPEGKSDSFYQGWIVKALIGKWHIKMNATKIVNKKDFLLGYHSCSWSYIIGSHVLPAYKNTAFNIKYSPNNLKLYHSVNTFDKNYVNGNKLVFRTGIDEYMETAVEGYISMEDFQNRTFMWSTDSLHVGINTMLASNASTVRVCISDDMFNIFDDEFLFFNREPTCLNKIREIINQTKIIIDQGTDENRKKDILKNEEDILKYDSAAVETLSEYLVNIKKVQPNHTKFIIYAASILTIQNKTRFGNLKIDHFFVEKLNFVANKYKNDNFYMEIIKTLLIEDTGFDIKNIKTRCMPLYKFSEPVVTKVLYNEKINFTDKHKVYMIFPVCNVNGGLNINLANPKEVFLSYKDCNLQIKIRHYEKKISEKYPIPIFMVVVHNPGNPKHLNKLKYLLKKLSPSIIFETTDTENPKASTEMQIY